MNAVMWMPAAMNHARIMPATQPIKNGAKAVHGLMLTIARIALARIQLV